MDRPAPLPVGTVLTPAGGRAGLRASATSEQEADSCIG